MAVNAVCVLEAPEPLTDALWTVEGELVCFRREPGVADLVRVADAEYQTLATGIPALGMRRHPLGGLVINTGDRLLRYADGSVTVIRKTSKPIFSYDVSSNGWLACVIGGPGETRTLEVWSPSGEASIVPIDGVLAAGWLDSDTLMAKRHELGSGAGATEILIGQPPRSLEVLLTTTLLLRAEMATNPRGLLFLSGGEVSGEGRGAWLIDGKLPAPFKSNTNWLPLGDADFCGESVAYGVVVEGKGGIVIASRDGAATWHPLNCQPPRQISASVDGSSLAWARPRQGRGEVFVCNL